MAQMTMATPDHVSSASAMPDGPGDLYVHVKRCRNLKNVATIGTSDPYVVVWRHGAKRKMQKTKHKNNNLNPVFNQSFKFDVAHTKSEGDLEFVVWDKNTLTSKVKMGKAFMSIKEVMRAGGKVDRTLNLEPEGTIDVQVMFEPR